MSAATLRRIQRLVGTGFYRFTTHALDSMAALWVSEAEVVGVVMNATECFDQESGRYRISEVLETEQEIDVIVEIEDEAVIVTVYERT